MKEYELSRVFDISPPKNSAGHLNLKKDQMFLPKKPFVLSENDVFPQPDKLLYKSMVKKYKKKFKKNRKGRKMAGSKCRDFKLVMSP